MIDRRRLLLAALLTIAPALAACGSVTAPADDPSSPASAADSLTARRDEVKPWG